METRRLSLETLPSELLFSITCYLPISSAAVLSLCSKHFYSVLGLRFLGQLREESAARFQVQQFLQLLSHDLPGCFACPACLKLHLHHWIVQSPDAPSIQSKDCPLYAIDEEAVQILFSGRRDIQWTRLNDIMRLKLAGLDIKYQLEQLSAEDYRDGLSFERMDFRTSQAGQLLMQERRRFIGRPYESFTCSHLNLSRDTGFTESDIASLLACLLSHQLASDQHSCRLCVRVTSCEFCASEFMIRRFDEPGTIHVPDTVGLVMTRWINLGDLSDPFEAFWRSHLSYGAITYSSENGEPQSLVKWQPGSIMTAWEHASD